MVRFRVLSLLLCLKGRIQWKVKQGSDVLKVAQHPKISCPLGFRWYLSGRVYISTVSLPPCPVKIMSNPESKSSTKFRFGSSDVSFSTLKDEAVSFSDLLGASNDKELAGGDTFQKTGDKAGGTSPLKEPKDFGHTNLDQKPIITGEEGEDQIFAVCWYFIEFSATQNSTSSTRQPCAGATMAA